MFRLPILQGVIKRRLLVNFRADPAAVQRILPPDFRPKLHHGFAIVGICLIRLEQIRPQGLPSALGLASENAAHRIAIEWTEPDGTAREGVYIPRRDTDSRLNALAGGRLFPGEHQHSRFTMHDDGQHLSIEIASTDGSMAISLRGHATESLPPTSCFRSVEEASAFFAGGCVGYSGTCDGVRLDGIELRTDFWKVNALAIDQVTSSYFSDPANFPRGSIEFDHCLIMSDIPHQWHSVPDFALASTAAG